MEQHLYNFNQETSTSPEHQESLVYMSPFEIKEEILKLFGINVTKEDFDEYGNIKNPTIKDQVYEALLEELEEGKSATLEFVITDKLLSKEDLQERGLEKLKQPSLALLQKSKGQARSNEIKWCIESGILTQAEIGDALYLLEKK
jgi:hypothetical protein